MTPTECLERAEQCESAAVNEQDASRRYHWLRLAEQWRELASELDKNRSSDP